MEPTLCEEKPLPPGFVRVRWVCQGVPQFETMEMCGLRELRKSTLYHTNGKAYKVVVAHRIENKLVASCFEVPPKKLKENNAYN